MKTILDKHAPFEIITKSKLKFGTKPWITPALQKSISIKNKAFKNLLKRKTTQKNELHNNYKIYRNLISTLMMRRKKLLE